MAAAFLTGIKPRKTAGSDATVGSPTIDQIIAQKIGQETLLPSLQLAVRGSELELEQLRRRLQLLVHELDLVGRLPTPPNEPVHADQPAADGAQSAGRVRAAVRQRRDARSARARMKQSRSILDSLVGELARLKNDLGPGEIADDQSVHRRDPRDRAAHPARGEGLEQTCRRWTCRRAFPKQFDEHIKLHFDLIALAFKADITRVVTLLGARDLTSRVYPFPKSALFPDGGTSVSFHGGSHHQDDPCRSGGTRSQPLSRVDAGVPGGEAEVDSRWRRHPARSLADHVRHQHGQLESAPALRRAAHPRRRRQRAAQGQSPPRTTSRRP